MPRGKKFTAEQIIEKLREAEVGLAQGNTVPEVVRKLGVTEQTYYRWKREYGGLRTDQAKRLKDLQKENANSRSDEGSGLETGRAFGYARRTGTTSGAMTSSWIGRRTAARSGC